MQRALCVFFELSGQSKVATLASREPTETRHDYTRELPYLRYFPTGYCMSQTNKINGTISFTRELQSVFYLSLVLTGQQILVVYPSLQLTIPPSKHTVLVRESSTLVSNVITHRHS